MNLSILRRLYPPSIRDRWAEADINAYFAKKVSEAKAAKNNEAVEQWNAEWAKASWDIEHSQRLRAQGRLFRKARKLYVQFQNSRTRTR